jgi:NAD(P)H-hydrate epimerase
VLFLTPESMREVDRRTIEGGTPGAALMEAAGRSVAQEVWRAWPRPEWRVAVLAGPGNNGGDGFVAARELLGRYAAVVVYLAAEPERLRGDARQAARAYAETGGETVPLANGESFRAGLARSDLLMDALLGTGTKGEVRGLARDLLEIAAGFAGAVVAVDAPSGLDMRTGAAPGPVPRAQLTVTFGAAKLGHALNDGPDHTGRLVVRDIGLDPEALADAARRPDSARALEPADAEALLPLPERRAHKRSNGALAVLAGSRRYAGAAALVCRGGLRSGAGLVYAIVPQELKPALNAAHPEVIVLGVPAGADGAFDRGSLPAVSAALGFARPDSLVLGPGLGAEDDTAAFTRQLIAGLDPGPPLLLDADGLNAFADDVGALREAGRRLRLAVTPHPGELGRLLGREARELDRSRLEAAREATRDLGCAVLLKGAPTVIACEGRTTLLNPTGNPGLARGGTGDVLSGLVGGFLAKRMGLFEALGLGAYVHGLAGDLARDELGSLGMTAGDVADRLPRALRVLEPRKRAEPRAAPPPGAWRGGKAGNP